MPLLDAWNRWFLSLNEPQQYLTAGAIMAIMLAWVMLGGPLWVARQWRAARATVRRWQGEAARRRAARATLRRLARSTTVELPLVWRIALQRSPVTPEVVAAVLSSYEAAVISSPAREPHSNQFTGSPVNQFTPVHAGSPPPDLTESNPPPPPVAEVDVNTFALAAVEAIEEGRFASLPNAIQALGITRSGKTTSRYQQVLRAAMLLVNERTQTTATAPLSGRPIDPTKFRLS